MLHTIEIKVRGYHLDIFGHVNNARYLEFLEEARWAMFEHAMELNALANQGYLFNVVNININYRRPARMNDLLVVASELKKINQRSAVISQVVKGKDTGTVVADADVTFVMVDADTQKAIKLEGPLLEVIRNV